MSRHNPTVRLLQGIGLLCALFFLSSGCGRGYQDDAALEKSVTIKFSYCRIENTVVLGVMGYNTSTHPIWGGRQLSFLVNGEEHEPLITVHGRWSHKPFIPNAPRGSFKHRTTQDVADALGVGVWTLEWKYGPIRSNQIILEIREDGSVHEVQVECEERVRRLAELHNAKSATTVIAK